MSETGTAKLFKHGRSHAVRLLEESGVLLEPIEAPFDVAAWFARIDEYLDEPFMPEGRQQPPTPSLRNRSNAEP